MNKILRFLEKYIIPKRLYQFGQPAYHFAMAFIAAFFYGFPSKRMKVIGVIGTKGKTTTCNLIAQILNFNGYKTGMATTVNFRIGGREWKNETKQTMLGRFRLQKLLKQMADERCEYAVVETSSEGILQYRHRFIDYDAAVFTNLSPEHIERHGGFENYRAAKVKLFKKVAIKKDGIGIYNLDDENVEYFLKPKVKIRYGYGMKFSISDSSAGEQFSNKFQISNIQLSPDKTEFKINNESAGWRMEMSLVGEFNVYNAAAAIVAVLSQGVAMEKIKEALKQAKPPAGRMEIIEAKGIKIVIDYAHEPASLEAVYKAVRNLQPTTNNSQLICLLGAQGGGRDKWKRPAMGKIAGQYCDEIILANEDPYDENPFSILEDIEKGFSQISNFKFQISNFYKIIDRREAIKKAISLAKEGDVVILTGKGGESSMCVAGGKKISWDERKVVEEILGK